MYTVYPRVCTGYSRRHRGKSKETVRARCILFGDVGGEFSYCCCCCCCCCCRWSEGKSRVPASGTKELVARSRSERRDVRRRDLYHCASLPTLFQLIKSQQVTLITISFANFSFYINSAFLLFFIFHHNSTKRIVSFGKIISKRQNCD